MTEVSRGGSLWREDKRRESRRAYRNHAWPPGSHGRSLRRHLLEISDDAAFSGSGLPLSSSNLDSSSSWQLWSPRPDTVFSPDKLSFPILFTSLIFSRSFSFHFSILFSSSLSYSLHFSALFTLPFPALFILLSLHFPPSSLPYFLHFPTLFTSLLFSLL